MEDRRSDPAPVDAALPATLAWAVRLLLLEGAALTLATAYLVVQDLTAAARDLGVAIGLTAFAALAAVVLVLLARALRRRAAAARGPAIVVQLMLLALGYSMVQAGVFWLGVPAIAAAIAVAALLVTPPTTRALGLR